MKAVVFSTTKCVWCDKVIRLLEDSEITVDKIDVAQDPQQLKEMLKVSNKAKTVPQVVIDGNFIGGYTEVERFLNHL
jgi:glutaredoxin 3